MRLAPVMLALLLALSPGAVASQASAPTTPAPADRTDTVRPAVTENTTAVLTLGTDPDRAAFDSPSVSLASSLETDRGEIRSDLDAKTLDQRLNNADSTEKRKQILNRYRFRIENRIVSLEAEEQRATSEFVNGSMSANEYVRTLGRLHLDAAEVKDAIDVLNSRAQEVPNFGIPDADRILTGKLVTFEGPVRDRITKSLQGRADPVQIHVMAAESGVVLTMITDEHYVREVYRVDNRDPSGSDQLSRDEVEGQVIEPQYPWVTDRNHYHTMRETTYGSLPIIRYMYYHNHGNLTAYVDTGTAKVFKEIQYKSLSGPQSLPPGPGVRNATEGVAGAANVTLTVNRTYAGGPLRVQLTNETGAPLDGTITVDGEPAGRTGEDGVLWTLSPSEGFRVSGTYEGTTINVTTGPVALDSNSSEG